ncbi:titin-like [Drosophila madeirensis]|uniref:Titin-like n=1 Tax=Drosophila madeirensis TaxID=30013 RepID=A0AAU9G4Y9_DROMD
MERPNKKKKAKGNTKWNNSTQPKEQNSDKKSTPEKPPVWRSNLKAKPIEGLQVVGVAERSSLKGWVTSVLGDGVTQADMELRSGVVFCQLIAQIYPGSIATSNIKLKAKMVHERAHNITLLKKALKQQETGMKEAEVTKRLSGSSNDLFEFLKYLQDMHVATVPPRPPVVAAAPAKKQPLKSKKRPLARIAPKKKTQVKKETKMETPTACDLSATVDSVQSCSSSTLTYAMPQEEEEAVPASKPEEQTPKPGVSMLQKLFDRQEFKRALADHLSVLDETDSDNEEFEYNRERIDRIGQGFFDIIYHFGHVMRDEIKASGGARTEKDIVLEILGDIRRMRIDVKELNRDGTTKSLYELKRTFISSFQEFVDIYQISADITTVPEVMTVERMPVHRHPRFKFNRRTRHWFPEYHPETMLNGKSLEHLPMLAKGQTLQEMLQQWNKSHGIKEDTEAKKEPQPEAKVKEEPQPEPVETGQEMPKMVPEATSWPFEEFPQFGVAQKEERELNPCEMEEQETGQQMPKMVPAAISWTFDEFPQLEVAQNELEKDIPKMEHEELKEVELEMMPEAISWPFEEFPQFGVAQNEERELNPCEMEEQATGQKMPKMLPAAISWTFDEFPQLEVAQNEERDMNQSQKDLKKKIPKTEHEELKEVELEMLPEAISWPFEEFPQVGVAQKEEREMTQIQKELKTEVPKEHEELKEAELESLRFEDPQFYVARVDERKKFQFRKELKRKIPRMELEELKPEAMSMRFEDPQFYVARVDEREQFQFQKELKRKIPKMELEELKEVEPEIMPEAMSLRFEDPQFSVARVEEVPKMEPEELKEVEEVFKMEPEELKEVEPEASPVAFDEPQSEQIFPTAETAAHSGNESLTFGFFENDELVSLLETAAGQRPATPEMAQNLFMSQPAKTPDCGRMVARKMPRPTEVKAATARALMSLLGDDGTLVRKNPVAPQETSSLAPTSPERNAVTEQFVWKTPLPTMMTLRAAVNFLIDFPEEDVDRLMMVVPMDESQIEEQLSTYEQLESSPDLQQLEPPESQPPTD